MIPVLIAQPDSTRPDRQEHKPSDQSVELSFEEQMQRFEEERADEERFVFKVVLTMLWVLVIPAIAMLLFMALYPESFQYEIVPVQDIL
ncbi:hypothetical protein K227x_54900 [Rubripirellula lacrimiformis]|uniref:Transmembrane protein n=1 Tax=Rubripirellula lacrimiformis TaxID=1930273 RepID=A0A517NIV6_9BACT|nr:hypothetical protein [Rubripirellula lacrimiformis]QDT07065.1 hypothetical protein K227x_54900 [Rubripirellula lacrimiformis]